MATRLPSLNIQCNVWQQYDIPTLGLPPRIPPFLAAVPCQLRTSQLTLSLFPLNAGLQVLVSILFVAHRDVRGPGAGFAQDVIECPIGTGRLYAVLGVEDRAKGFPNEHRVAICRQLTNVIGGWRYPTP